MIYLDNAATTKPDKKILDKIYEINLECYGNPSSLYAFGQKSKEYIQQSQNMIGEYLGCSPNHIIFTSGGTESDNLAIIGICSKYPDKRHVITSSIEHKAVLNTMRHLEKCGYDITYLPVYDGIVDIEDIEKAIRDDTALISVMAVNNEIGSIQPFNEIGKLAHKHGIKYHCDAVQGMNICDFDMNNIDLLSISGHKIHTPKGIGCLYAKNLDINNIMFGGRQNNELRPGTENCGYIYGLGLAIQKIQKFDLSLKNYLIEKLPYKLNGKSESHIVNFQTPLNGQFAVIRLGLKDICISSGSACNSGSAEISHVLKSLGLDEETANKSLRVSLSNETTKEDIDKFLYELENLVGQI